MSVLTMMEAAKRNSIIHRLNPFTKGLFCICMIAAPIVTINPFVSIPILIILWLLALPAGLKDVFYPTMCKMYPVMLSFIIIIWPFFYPKGEIVLLDWAFIHITLDGIYYAVAQGLRIAVAITGCLFFVMTTEIVDVSTALGKALQRVGIGYTAPFMLTTSFKFLPEFMASYTTIKESFMTRGFQLDKGGFVQKLKNFIPLFIPLIDSSLNKSQNIASAMLLRAFGVTKQRTFYTQYSFKMADVLYILMSIGLLAFAIYGQQIHLGGFNLTL